MPDCSDKPVIWRAQEVQTTWHYLVEECSSLVQSCGDGNHLCVNGQRIELEKRKENLVRVKLGSKKYMYIKQHMAKISSDLPREFSEIIRNFGNLVK